MSPAIRRVCIDHLVLPVSDLAASGAFYTAALAPLGMAAAGETFNGRDCASFGPEGSEDFWIERGTPTRALHLAFGAENEEQVRAFHAAALAAGATSNGEPGERPEYHPGYYGAFVLDPDGNNVEAVFHGG